jgi:hypothetical protein
MNLRLSCAQRFAAEPPRFSAVGSSGLFGGAPITRTWCTKMLCLISNQHRDIANLVTRISVAVRFHDLVERISATDHGAQFAGVDQLLQKDEISLLRIGCAGDESRPSKEVY